MGFFDNFDILWKPSVAQQEADLEYQQKKDAYAQLLQARKSAAGLLQFDQTQNAPVNTPTTSAPLDPSLSMPGGPTMQYASQVTTPGTLGGRIQTQPQYSDALNLQNLMVGAAGGALPYFQAQQAKAAEMAKPQKLGPDDIIAAANGQVFARNPKTAEPKFETIYDSQGREQKVQLMPDGSYKPIGGAKTDDLGDAVKRSEIAKNTSQAAMTESAKLSGDALDTAADQMLAGDTSVMQGLGYGALGASNRTALRNRVTELAKSRGMGGADIAAMNAEYFGTKAGERTLGARSANIEMAVNEAGNMGKLARKASDAVPRGAWMPVNAAMQAWNEGTGTPEARQFGAANNSFLNAYATAVGKGTMTVDARNHAQEMLSTADGPMAYAAIMDQLDKEMEAARQAPGQVRGALRGAITGGDQQKPNASKVQKWGRDASGKPVLVQ